MPDQIAIELNQVTKIYQSGGSLLTGPSHLVTALNSVDLSIYHGEIFGLVGESGSGKTTAGRLIVRLEKPDQGTIRVLGQPVDKLRARELKHFRHRVQMIFQDPYQSLNPYVSVKDTVAEPLQIHHDLKKADQAIRVVKTLETVGLTPAMNFFHAYPHQLSGGQRQRVAIARAMVLEPEVVVADEPTSMLDASIAVQIYKILVDIQQRRRMTLIFITHSLAAAHYMCHRIAVIYRGHIVELGPAKSVIGSPRHPYTRALLDALPKYGRVRTEPRYNTLRHKPRKTVSDQGCIFYSRCTWADKAKCAERSPLLRQIDGNQHAACFFAQKSPTDF
jgi:peptide/nickel transport system ATP-binding protein